MGAGWFLYAKRDVPAFTELGWDYGNSYVREWKHGSDNGDLTDDDVEWRSVRDHLRPLLSLCVCVCVCVTRVRSVAT